MPLLHPDPVNSLLQEAGLSGRQVDLPEGVNPLDFYGLSKEQLAQELARDLQSDSPMIRARAIENAMKAQSMLTQKESERVLSITVNIFDPDAPKGVNPILVPREVSID